LGYLSSTSSFMSHNFGTFSLSSFINYYSFLKILCIKLQCACNVYNLLSSIYTRHFTMTKFFLDSTFFRARSQWTFILDPMVELLNESPFKEGKQMSVEVNFKSWLKKTLHLTHSLLMFLGWDQHPWKQAQLREP
jgi:hypothetical protein